MLTSYGRIQDKQASVHDTLQNIRYMAVTVGDGNLGPFQLEIDVIATVVDYSHKETFAYEMYENKSSQQF